MLGLFEGFGVELEYMIVDGASLNVAPVADKLLERAAGEPAREWARGNTSWCNELALHVIEFKFTEPWESLTGAADAFSEDVRLANQLLAKDHCRLLPSAMHPWMEPISELRLWPHENEEIYAAYDRIFSCKGHGWANLQSTHINLPFADDAEFGRLHAAIRAVLPLLPGLAASSPCMDGSCDSALDNRIFTYKNNAASIPSVTGLIIPEPVFSIETYHERILRTMYRDIAPHDPDGILQEDWLNSRGAIARFERQSIEIRLIDIQECPAADLAIVEWVCATVRALCEERWAPLTKLQDLATRPLHDMLLDAARHGERASVEPTLAHCLGLREGLTIREAVLAIAESLDLSSSAEAWLTHYRAHGTLASRIRKAHEEQSLLLIYRDLADCLAGNRYFA